MFKQNGEPAYNYELCEGTRAIAAVLGRRRALEIAGALMKRVPPSKGNGRAGRMACVYVPVSLARGEATRLIEAAGREDAEKLIRAFRGETLWVSACHNLMLRHRNDAIREQRNSGASTKFLAASFGLTQREIWRICRT